MLRHVYYFGIALLVTVVFFCMTYLPLNLRTTTSNDSNEAPVRRRLSIDDFYHPKSQNEQPMKILHIVTTLNELDTGTRGTLEGHDRFSNILVPRVVDTVSSIKKEHPRWEVDVYLILGFEVLSNEKFELLKNALPPGTGLEIWEDAAPLYYDVGSTESSPIIKNTRALARQHRFVVKDKLQYYDFFSCWEDDMRINAVHIENFLSMSNKLNSLKLKLDDEYQRERDLLQNSIPGFIRVEVLQEGERSQTELDPGIPVDTTIDMMTAEPCCSSNNSIFEVWPDPDKIVLWETGIRALAVTYLPDDNDGAGLGWMALLPGPRTSSSIPSYWSGQGGAFGSEYKNPGASGDFFANPGGWMATREQVEYFDSKCPGGFLPPYENDFWHGDSGMKPMNVEFWSGGYQLFGKCGIQRLISINPEIFSKQLIHHTANNKQRTLPTERMVVAQTLLGQLHSVKAEAIKNQWQPIFSLFSP